MSENLEPIFADVFILHDPNTFKELTYADFSISATKLLSNFSGEFKIEDTNLYLLCESSFKICKLGINRLSHQSVVSIENHSIKLNCKDFFIDSGKLYTLSNKQISIYNLKNKELKKIDCKDDLLSMVILRGQVFVTTQRIVYSIQGAFLKNHYSSLSKIHRIKASYYDLNSILIIEDQEYIVINDEGEEIFRYFNENPCDVNFLNNETIVVYDQMLNQLLFMKLSEDNDTFAKIDLSGIEVFEIKVKENIILLFDKDSGNITCIIYDEEAERFIGFLGVVGDSFENIDFDCDEVESQRRFGQLSGFSCINFFISRENNLYHFSIKICIEILSGIVYTFRHPILSVDDQIVEYSGNVKHQPLDLRQVFKMKDNIIPKFPEFQKKNIEEKNFVDNRINLPADSSMIKRKYLSEIRDIFSSKNLKRIIDDSLNKVEPLRPKQEFELPKFVNTDELQRIGNEMKNLVNSI